MINLSFQANKSRWNSRTTPRDARTATRDATIVAKWDTSLENVTPVAWGVPIF